MAKKSSKSSRKARTAKQTQARNTSKSGKQKPLETAAEQGFDEMKPTAPKKPTTKAEATPTIPNSEAEQVAEENVQPQRTRMLVNAAALGVVIIVLVFVAVFMRQQASRQSGEVVRSNGDSSKADEVLRTGGSVCTNGPAQTDPQAAGSTNPESVGMMLQNNPSNTIQTPQTLSADDDTSTLQGAACF